MGTSPLPSFMDSVTPYFSAEDPGSQTGTGLGRPWKYHVENQAKVWQGFLSIKCAATFLGPSLALWALVGVVGEWVGLTYDGHCLFMFPEALVYIFFLWLVYNCFTMLCEFLLYNEVNQLYVYIYPHPPPLGPFSYSAHPTPLGHHRTHKLSSLCYIAGSH